jgi:FkbM family methyltransferase
MVPNATKLVRTVQNYFPFAKNGKDAFYRHYRRLARRPHEKDFEALALLDFGRAPCMVDIGANHGQSVESIRLFVPNAQIIAFEANPRLAKKLAGRYSRPVTIVPKGLSDRPTTSVLFVPSYRGFEYDGLASLQEEEARDWLSSRTVYWFDPRRLTVEKLACEIDVLDAYELKPDFIKIDVQGGEYGVLLGGRETIAKHRPVILLEDLHGSPEATALVRSLGYDEYYYDGVRLNKGRSPSTNSFLLTPDRAATMAALQ